MKEKILKNRKLIDTAIIFLVACILSIILLKPNLDVYYDDGIQHIGRAFGTLASIKQNGLFPNVISNFANNFGYSWNLFYGPLSAYGVIVCALIFRNFITGYKIFCFICLILSGIFMYKFASKLINNNNAALLASIIYLTFPYHLTDLYTRNALGEFVSFVFIPLVFLGLYNLFYTEDNHYYISIGAIGLILTHNISTLLVAIFSLFYVIFNLEKIKESRIKKGLIINIVFIILVTSFFWVPLLETKLYANYRVYESEAMSTSEEAASHGLKLKQLFVTQKDGSYIFELGPHIIILLAFSVMTIRRISSELRENYIIFLFCSLITLWMSTKYFPWKFLPDGMSIIQFPWRMLMFSSFFLSLVCAINVYTIIKKFNYKDVLVISIIAIGYTLAIFMSYVPTSENIANIDQINLGNFSGKEHETVAGAGKGEYLPSNAYKDRFYVATKEDVTTVLEGKAIIENETKDGSNLKANVKTLDAEYTIFELPYLYYPGYEVRLDGMIAETFETKNGFLGFAMGPEDNIELSVNYTGTSSMKYSLLVSVVSCIALGIYIWKKH